MHMHTHTHTHTHISAHELCFLTDTGDVPVTTFPSILHHRQAGATTTGQDQDSRHSLCSVHLGLGSPSVLQMVCGGRRPWKPGRALGPQGGGLVLGDRRRKNWSSLLVGTWPPTGAQHWSQGGWTGRAGEPRPVGPPTGHSVLKGSHKIEQLPLLIPEGSHHSRNLSPSAVTPLSPQPRATTHLVSIRISLFRVFPINGIP